ncbi:Protein CBG10265 [Caenorhabditis briggsae]|uniref:Protein CBG10265 n=1 Tax=Caenorhabditis briggsae TaxID=6238 RepID=A8XAR1_CAEBR|nr:Protein CBG10265 [Caenorhabditis briggsae]CAP29726.1 Protein CBG10265 [Caenorhabditis briggsae]
MSILTAVRVEKYWKLTRKTFQFSPKFNAVRGGNSTGKTTLFSAIKFALSDENSSVNDPLGDVTLTFQDNNGGNFSFRRLRSGGNSKYFFNEDKVEFTEYSEELKQIGVKLTVEHVVYLDSWINMIENPKEVLNLLESLNPKVSALKAECEELGRDIKKAKKQDFINKKRIRHVKRSIEAISALATRNYQQICQKPNVSLKMELEENPLDGVIMSQSDGGFVYHEQFSGGQKARGAMALVLAVAERSENSFVIFDNLDNTIFQEHFPIVSKGIHAVSNEIQVIIGSRFKELAGSAESEIRLTELLD